MRLLLSVALCASLSCYGIDTIFEKSINSFTRDVYYRYYLIQRCQEPVELLQKNLEIWNKIKFENLDLSAIKNDAVRKKATLIQNQRFIQPFLDLWHQICSHRHIDDASFHKDFVKFLFMLYKALEIPTSHKIYADPCTYSIENMLSFIERHIQTMNPLRSTKDKADNAFPDTHQITTDDIALNYYLIQRLDKPIKLLIAMHEEFRSLNTGWFDHATCGININFSHERMNYCFNQMTMRKNLDPFLHTWQEFSRFRHAGDAHFLKEMLMMLFTVYKDLLFVKLNEESEEVITTEMSTILDLYEHIDELPLDEILQAIDLTTDKLVLLQNIEKKGKTEWRQQYPIIYHTLLALPLAYFIIKTCAV